MEAKKPKIKIDEDLKNIEKKEFVPLDSLKELLENKLNKLSRKNLEEFCIQKICEVIGQNSELGELRHQIKVQEQMLETWRNKVVAISKQTRDLEIVKCRLIQDMRAKEKDGGKVSDTTPVKITRSVGLQVCLQPGMQRNRPSTGTPTTTTINTTQNTNRGKARQSLPGRLPNTSSTVQTKSSPVNPSKPPTPSKTIKTIPPRAQEPKTSILTNALQKQQASTPARKPAEAPKAVIDLTDEDENKAAPQPVMLVQTHQMSNAVTTSAPIVTTSVPAPRLTYQQVMLHTFAPSNAPTRPGQVRTNFMLRPIQPNARKLTNLCL